MDLFKPVVPNEKLHPNFRKITTAMHFEPELAILRSWANGFRDRDGKFVQEFQTSFNSSFWELYLLACFRELQATVDLSFDRPDFVITGSPSGPFVAEATTALHPEGYTPEWDRVVSPETIARLDMEGIVNLASLRLAGALRAKHSKYVQSYATLAQVKGLPFVVCLAPFEQPYFYLQNDQAIRRVLYAEDVPLGYYQ